MESDEMVPSGDAKLNAIRHERRTTSNRLQLRLIRETIFYIHRIFVRLFMMILRLPSFLFLHFYNFFLFISFILIVFTFCIIFITSVFSFSFYLFTFYILKGPALEY